MRKFWVLLLVVFLVVACREDEEPAPPTPVPDTNVEELVDEVEEETSAEVGVDSSPGRGLLISEILPGIPGNNNHEFIELYNPGREPITLRNWTLNYQLGSDRDPTTLIRWTSSVTVPPQGHYLLIREGTEIDILSDATYSEAISSRGILSLNDGDGNIVTSVAYGDIDVSDTASAPSGGASLERLPGGEAGNGQDTGDFSADYVSNATPNPQNTGSDLTPTPDAQLITTLQAPILMEPGTDFLISVTVENATGQDVENVTVILPIPFGLSVERPPDNATEQGQTLEWTIGALADGAERSFPITLQSPLTYDTMTFSGYYAEVDGFLAAFGGPHILSIEGGSIPIAIARSLRNQTVTIEGVATMYTGGFFAGSDGVKFYVEDETGGIQVYVDGGDGIIDIEIGDVVRVTGNVELYRDSLELVPQPNTEVVSVVESAEAPAGTAVPLSTAATDEELLGTLAVVEGLITSITENSFDYTIDLVDEDGNMLLILIERDTGIDIDALEVGQNYQVTGIVELYSARWQLKPRVQADFAQIFPPALYLTMDAPLTAPAGSELEVTLTASNYTAERMSNVLISMPAPLGGTVVPGDYGLVEDGSINWLIPELEGNGGEVVVSFRMMVNGEEGAQIVFPAGQATSDQWSDPATSFERSAFIGTTVPIWAIQGDGFASPLTRANLTARGVVIGVFSELNGFWIQETDTDDDPATSAGLFVYAPNAVLTNLNEGTLVEVSGRVSESFEQTNLEINSTDSINIIGERVPVPAPVELNPPADPLESSAYFESVEGMLVQISTPALAVAPTSRFGEFAIIRAETGLDRIVKGQDPIGHLIFVNDGTTNSFDDGSELPYAVASGDLVSGLVGPLSFSFGNYKIEPTSEYTVTAGDGTLPSLPELGDNEFSVATYNAENLFDTQSPHPSSPPQLSNSEYEHRLNKTANAILAMGTPTIIGLQEIENVGVLEDIAAMPQLAVFGYEAALIEGDDSRGIDVGYLVRGDQARIDGAVSLPGPDNLTSRHPLLISVTLTIGSEETQLHLLNNHFLSLSAGEEATEPQRTAQAAWNATLVQRILDNNPDANIIVLGDLNSFYDTLPIHTLENVGLRHVYEFVEPFRPYTYIFEGQSETLDHILVTQGLYDRLVRVEALHINSDYPLAFPDDASPQRASDHDPLVAVFSLD